MTKKELIALLHECRTHVYRQQHAGKHEQDRADAKELLPRVVKALRGWDISK